MLGPEEREDRELEVVGLPPEERDDALELAVRETESAMERLLGDAAQSDSVSGPSDRAPRELRRIRSRLV
jgi:hypothetical protein